MSKELLDFCQCSSGLLLTLHLFFWLHSLSLQLCAQNMYRGLGGTEEVGSVVSERKGG